MFIKRCAHSPAMKTVALPVIPCHADPEPLGPRLQRKEGTSEKVREITNVVLECCCGLDVYKKTVTAGFLYGPLEKPSRELLDAFATTTKGLLELRGWLERQGCTHVAMKSTGIYGRPVYHILEGAVTRHSLGKEGVCFSIKPL